MILFLEATADWPWPHWLGLFRAAFILFLRRSVSDLVTKAFQFASIDRVHLVYEVQSLLQLLCSEFTAGDKLISRREGNESLYFIAVDQALW